MSSRSPTTASARLELTGSTSGFVSLPVYQLGRRGHLRAVKVRLDAVDGNATAVDLYLMRDADDVVAAPDDLDVFYKNLAIALTADATAASEEDHLGDVGGAEYAVGAVDPTLKTSTLKLVGNVTATGLYKIHVELRADVAG